MFDEKRWTRLEFQEVPVYLRGDGPEWFVPNQAGDAVLQSLAGEPACPGDSEAFLARLPDRDPGRYPGRSQMIKQAELRELWFHITDRCNLACSHCLFSCSTSSKRQLSRTRIAELGQEAYDLGCRVFALTGGEPMIHHDFEAIVTDLLARPDSRVVVLTNGLLLKKHSSALARWAGGRFHLQVSLDGIGAGHDLIRGPGTFDRLIPEMAWLKEQAIPYTLSLCVQQSNAEQMPAVVDLAAKYGAANVHFMWIQVRGRAQADEVAAHDQIFTHLCEAYRRADRPGVGIDNIDALRSQIFAPSGTIHDGTNCGWESAAVGPDGKLYPSAALIGKEELATKIDGRLAEAWQDSAVLGRLREATSRDLDTPWKYLLGGGDTDQSYTHGGEFVGKDPYHALYEKIALWLISQEASSRPIEGLPRLRLKMGDILESCGAHGSVALAHSNCLVSLAQDGSRAAVRDFYSRAAAAPNLDILNPASYPLDLVDHVPEACRVRSYGCGSPILDAGIEAGQHVVDLGSGSGLECFIAARMVGPDGLVEGVDMLDPMLALARKGAEAVEAKLGYGNLRFVKAYLENLPQPEGEVDVVLSNCVINLSRDKRTTYEEIFRVLRPGGKLVVSDVICDQDPDPAIRNDDELRGQCIGGALTGRDLFGLLQESGFVSCRVLRRFPYRVVKGHRFFSLTFEAQKPRPTGAVRVMYRGPFAGVLTRNGKLLLAGQVLTIDQSELPDHGDSLLELDQEGMAVNVAMESCCAASQTQSQGQSCDCDCDCAPAADADRFLSGCMVCGAKLRYSDRDQTAQCVYCQQSFSTQACCKNGHYICDSCHSQEAAKVIEHICLSTDETDMMTLMTKIRSHPSIPLHGPEHHAMVPAIILATYRNLGGDLSPELIRTGINHGRQVAGGSCAFTGACGAATGVGIAFGLILGSSPVKGKERRTVMSATHDVIGDLGQFEAARCCQRDCFLALKRAVELSAALLPINLIADEVLHCGQRNQNQECMGAQCPVLQQEKADACHEAKGLVGIRS